MHEEDRKVIAELRFVAGPILKTPDLRFSTKRLLAPVYTLSV